jgi:hypothetical protein
MYMPAATTMRGLQAVIPGNDIDPSGAVPDTPLPTNWYYAGDLTGAVGPVGPAPTINPTVVVNKIPVAGNPSARFEQVPGTNAYTMHLDLPLP